MNLNFRDEIWLFVLAAIVLAGAAFGIALYLTSGGAENLTSH